MIPFGLEFGDLIFAGIAFLVVASASWVVLSPNLVHSAVSLLFSFFGIAGLYIFLFADFIAATQVVIYVGGILVLIIFGVMLTNKIQATTIESKSYNKIIAGVCSVLLFVVQVQMILYTKWNVHGPVSRDSTIKDIGRLILNDYLLPFEIVSILLLGALIGAALLSRKRA
tara:strand:- start:83 stop:592 length:510 start_codon:yes stop_codon:yes gene_type:complete